ncbi:MAG: Smr/MutS family protein [Bacteroidales bacterium]|nr:Smr/MutS family protein [Bacteroidales bacterium]
MIYPENFERKIGFDEIRTLLKGRCISSLGTEWVDYKLTFMTDYDSVKRALDEAVEATRLFDESDELELNFFDVRQALLRIRPERTHMEELELFDLKRSLKTVVDFIAFLNDADEDVEENAEDAEAAPTRFPALRRMAEGVACFPDLVDKIDDVLNKYGKVKDTASPELLTIRHTQEQTVRSISHSLRSIIAEAQSEGYIDRDVSPTLRDGRLVIPVPPAVKRKIKGIIHDESATGKTVFIEPTAIVEANNRIRELKAAERREIIRILQELTLAVRPHVTEILASQQFLGHIDYLRALSSFSQTFKAIVPNVVKYPMLNWVQAVHPLLQQSLERHGRKMIPLDITLPQGKRILLISGPNAGGKSVCLKTVGLLQYMLQCGMPVSAKENSTAGIFDDIFIDIGDEQSIEDDLSTYSSHLINMKQMMRHCGERSLLLIDEFGGGTEPQIGGALAEAMLNRFVAGRAFGIITTHYQNLKLFAQNESSVVNGAMLYDRTRMQPLFMLQIGNPGSSFAIEIARKIGLPEEVIEYATKLVGKDYVMSDKYLLDITRDKRYWENKRLQIHRQEKQLEETINKYESEMEQFQAERKNVMRQAKAEAENLLQATNARIENTIRTIRESQAEKERTLEARRELEEFKSEMTSDQDKEDRIARKIAQIKRRQERKKAGKANAANGTAANATQSAAAESTATTAPTTDSTRLRVGSFVRMKGQSSIGRIDSINGKQAKVLFGMMYTLVKLDNLVPSDAPAAESNVTKVATFVSKETREAVYEKKLNFKPQLDLRGMRGDEALSATAYFIDDAILLEQAQVRILHGTGTGALREIVRDYLATVPGVKRYHDEHVQFGGAGITVVELE